MDLLNVIVVSALPFSELRGGIPLGIFYYGFTPEKAYIVAVLGNLLPVPFLLLFLENLRNFFMKSRFAPVYTFFERRTEKKRKIIDKYGYLGLLLFVAIPLPVTGAWTGSLISFLLKLNPARSFMFIALGVLTAGLIVTATVIGVFSLSFLIKI
ncbi:MAG TPA: ligand-binding protein SH3 [Archaeoglobaceae archaeon]|nr:ligand-binding protein SH3 [Archaeoglobaceae archaeon]